MRHTAVPALLVVSLASTVIATPMISIPRNSPQPYSASGDHQHSEKSVDYTYTSNSISTYDTNKGVEGDDSESTSSSNIQCEQNEHGGCDTVDTQGVSGQTNEIHEVGSGGSNGSMITQGVVLREKGYGESDSEDRRSSVESARIY
jgi:hypothetical protein